MYLGNVRILHDNDVDDDDTRSLSMRVRTSVSGRHLILSKTGGGGDRCVATTTTNGVCEALA